MRRTATASSSAAVATASWCATRLGAPKRFAYGPTPIEGLDVYTDQAPNAPINVFIHGGAWRGGAAKDYGYHGRDCSSMPARITSCPTSTMSIEAGGNLMPMADQVRRAVAWVYKNATSFGGDPNRIYVSGHSSGGASGRRVLIDRLAEGLRPAADVIKGGAAVQRACTISSRCGCRSARDYVKFTDEMEDEASAAAPSRRAQLPGDRRLRHLRDAGVPAPEPRFRRGREGGRQAGHAAGRRGYNHFEMPETLGNPYGLLGRAALEQMKLARLTRRWGAAMIQRLGRRSFLAGGAALAFTARRARAELSVRPGEDRHLGRRRARARMCCARILADL